MRIDRIDIDIPGWSALSGTYDFPAEGVALWAGANGIGKSMLVSLVATGFYGVPRSGGDVPPSGWLMIRCILDGGESLEVARDLGTGAVQVTDATGIDVTDRWSEAPSLGEALLGFTRSQFLTVARVGLDDLAATVAHPELRSMLSNGRGRPSQPTVGTPPPAPSRDTQSEPPSADDLPIFHNAAEEMQWVASGHFSAGDRVLDLDGSSPPATPSDNVAAARDRAPDPEVARADDPASQLRSLKRELDRAVEEHAARNQEYRQFREQLGGLYTERDRLGALEGAEPKDVARLEELIGVLKKVMSRRQKIRAEEDRFREELAERAIPAEQLEPIDRKFRNLPEESRRFLESHRQTETILRGNQALTRSESRLDESRIQEIERSRADASRMAITPLAVAIVGLFGAAALPFFPEVPVPPSVPLGVGLLGVVAGAALLLHAKRLRRDERRELLDTLTRKKEQMTQFDREAYHASARLDEMAQAIELEDGQALLRQYNAWQARVAELDELAGFQKQTAEIDREAAVVRDKLASFTMSSNDPSGLSDTELDAMVDDYIRHFAVRDQIVAAETRAARLEDTLAREETAIADHRIQIAAMLEAEDVDTSGDLDQAIEAFALRSARRSGPPATASESTSGWREIDPDDLSLDDPSPSTDTEEAANTALASDGNGSGPADWNPGLSARMEAILRRWVPAARAIDIDTDLVPHLKLDPAGPTICGPRLDGCGSALRDHVYLALRLAIVETLSSAGERIPVFLDDPFVRSDDARHDLAIRFLVEDASQRGQVVYLTSQEVRIRWFQHQNPQLAGRLAPMRSAPEAARSASDESSALPANESEASASSSSSSSAS